MFAVGRLLGAETNRNGKNDNRVPPLKFRDWPQSIMLWMSRTSPWTNPKSAEAISDGKIRLRQCLGAS
jgi:hypothetical protein